MSYLGFSVATAAELAPLAAATGPFAPFVMGFAALADVGANLHIGAGRKEADAIGPTQVKLGQTLGALDGILNQTLTVDDLRQLDSQMRGIWAAYINFLYQDAFTADGDTRASDQSVATMEPQVQGRLDRISTMLNALMGRPNVPTTIQSGGPASLEFRTSSDLVLPQAGFRQPGSIAPTNYAAIGPAAPAIDQGLLLKLAVAGGLVFLISRR